MDEERRRPTYSTLSDSSNLEDSIHEFVVSLAEQVDMLQDDEISSDFEALEERASVLSTLADSMGYPEFARAALKVSEACSEEFTDTVQKGLLELTDLARSIRLGHRGAS